MTKPELVDVVDDRILREIREALPADRYGNKYYLMGQVKWDVLQSCFSVYKKRGECGEGYDCIDASLKAKKILSRRGMPFDLCAGKSEDGIFGEKGHTFLNSGEVILDPTPLYEIVGAQHIIQEKFSEEQLSGIDNVIDLNGGSVTSFHRKDGYSYMVSARIDGCYSDQYKKEINGVLLSILKKGEVPEEYFRIYAKTDCMRMRTLMERIRPLENTARLGEVSERLDMLASKNAIRLEKSAYDLKMKARGELERTEKDLKLVSGDSQEIILKDMDVLLHLIEGVFLAQ